MWDGRNIAIVRGGDYETLLACGLAGRQLQAYPILEEGVERPDPNS